MGSADGQQRGGRPGNQTARNRPRRILYRWFIPFGDPRRTLAAVAGFGRYFKDWYRYAKLPGAEPVRIIDAQPELHDRTEETPFDAHYFYMCGWAARRIRAHEPAYHVDLGSHVLFINVLAAWVPVIFVDFRPLRARLTGLRSVAAGAVALPFRDNSLTSISCLSVAEHIGLGRYGDVLDVHGTPRTANELTRVLARGGRLYFAVPVGDRRIAFNAHRIHPSTLIRSYFADLELVEFSAVDEDGVFHEEASLQEFDDCEYACGMFQFTKPCV